MGSATFTFDYFSVKTMKKLSIWVFALLVLTACGGSYENETQLLVKHLRVVFTEAPATHAIVSWTATAPTAVNEIYYGEAPISAVSPRKEANKSGKITLRAADIAAGMTQAYYHHVELNDLKPATRYYLRVCNDGKCSEDFYFKTADPTNHNISLLSGGDSRMREEDEGTVTAGPHTDRRNMNLRLKALLEADSTVLALAHGADYCVTADWRYLHNWFEDWSMTTTSDKRLLPLLVSRGNHDHEIGFNECFWLGEISNANSEGYYFYTALSDSIGLITLNTETSMAGYQLKWLRKTLAKQRPVTAWLLAQYHKPAYPAVKNYEREDFVRVRTHWVPLFEAHQLDLALESDGHALKRTMPILNGAYHPKGLVYVGEGGLGVPQRKPAPSRWYFQNGGKTSSAHHVWKLDFDLKQLQLTAIGLAGDTLDQWQLQRR